MPDDPKNQPATPLERRPPARLDPAAKEPAGSETGAPPPKELTPEEQMERYEDALKESDWGHQPC